MTPKYTRGNVVIVLGASNMPIPPRTPLIIRSVFTVAETKEEARRTFCHLNVTDDTPVYFCSDCHGQTYFIPEYHTVVVPEDGVRPEEHRQEPALTLADPSIEMSMVLLDEVRNIKYMLSKRHNGFRRGGPRRSQSDEDTPQDDADRTGGTSLWGRLSKW